MKTKPTLVFLAMPLACAMLAACGNKGGLTLPPKDGTPQQKTTAKPAPSADHNSVAPPAKQ